MEDNKKRYITPPSDNKPLKDPIAEDQIRRVREYRLSRTKEALLKNDVAAVLLYDPLNIRYATDTSNMQLWTAHNPCRYALVFAEGPVLLFEFHNCSHLHTDKVLPDGRSTVDEIRPAISWTYFLNGYRAEEQVVAWADDITEALREFGGGNMRLAVDSCDEAGIRELHKRGVNTLEGMQYMEHAREIKSDDEMELMKWTITVAQRGMQRMHEHCHPGITENELWAHLHFENIRHGGEWIETRILSSGERTNPWMNECSKKIIQPGDLVSFDTDLIGPYGYCADISRSWIAGHEKPTKEQQHLYDLAKEHVNHNMDILKEGVSYREFGEKEWKIPDEYRHNRYGCTVHGVGLCDEYPCLYHYDDFDVAGYDGVFVENMVVCVESYIGALGAKEGVKLEQQVRITKEGFELLSDFPMDGFN